MTPQLFAGNRVSDFAIALPWYERLLGAEPSFFPHDTEAVWELSQHGLVYVVENADRSGGSLSMLFYEDVEAVVAEISARGIEPVERERYPGKARKAIYRDADGNRSSRRPRPRLAGTRAPPASVPEFKCFWQPPVPLRRVALWTKGRSF